MVSVPGMLYPTPSCSPTYWAVFGPPVAAQQGPSVCPFIQCLYPLVPPGCCLRKRPVKLLILKTEICCSNLVNWSEDFLSDLLSVQLTSQLFLFFGAFEHYRWAVSRAATVISDQMWLPSIAQPISMHANNLPLLCPVPPEMQLL